MQSRLPIQERAGIPAASPSLEELAAQQGVRPVREFAELLGERHPDDESVEKFSRLLRSWRSEGTGAESRP